MNLQYMANLVVITMLMLNGSLGCFQDRLYEKCKATTPRDQNCNSNNLDGIRCNHEPPSNTEESITEDSSMVATQMNDCQREGTIGLKRATPDSVSVKNSHYSSDKINDTRSVSNAYDSSIQSQDIISRNCDSSWVQNCSSLEIADNGSYYSAQPCLKSVTDEAYHTNDEWCYRTISSHLHAVSACSKSESELVPPLDSAEMLLGVNVLAVVFCIPIMLTMEGLDGFRWVFQNSLNWWALAVWAGLCLCGGLAKMVRFWIHKAAGVVRSSILLGSVKAVALVVSMSLRRP
eukprot:Filipodium_phascolosomae@DN3038_c0_g1_i1.p1